MEESQPGYNWLLLPKNPYVMKFAVNSSSYWVLASNLTYIYSEHLQEKDILNRFHALNPFANMKSDLILHHINSALFEFVDNKCSHSLLLEKENQLMLTLNISTKLFECKYEIKMNLLPVDQIMNHVIGPILQGAVMAELKVKELENKISNADRPATSNSLSNFMLSTSTASEEGLSFNPNQTKYAMESNFLPEKVSTEVALSSFVKLQSFFIQLAADQKNMLEKSSASSSPKKASSTTEKCSVQIGGPIKFEDGISDQVELNSSVQCSSSKTLVVKKAKKFKF